MRSEGHEEGHEEDHGEDYWTNGQIREGGDQIEIWRMLQSDFWTSDFWTPKDAETTQSAMLLPLLSLVERLAAQEVLARAACRL